MDFFGPQAADFANVTALNHAWLVRLRDPQQGGSLRRELPASIRILIEGLTDLQVERLAATPFLLFSMQERDESGWRNLGRSDPNLDLLAGPANGGDELRTTAVSFLWQLAARNPYAARLISGAGLDWCEQLAACTLLEALRAADVVDDLLQPRFPDDQDFWTKLLGPGLSSNAGVSHSAHITCLQRLLTGDPSADYRRLRSAACRSTVPAMSVAEKARPR